MLHLNRSLDYLVKACQSKDDQLRRRNFIQQSLDEIHLTEQRLRKSEHDQFVNWYANDIKFGMDKMEQRLKNISKKTRLT